MGLKRYPGKVEKARQKEVIKEIKTGQHHAGKNPRRRKTDKIRDPK
jgi:hypothetical protein